MAAVCDDRWGLHHSPVNQSYLDTWNATIVKCTRSETWMEDEKQVSINCSHEKEDPTDARVEPCIRENNCLQIDHQQLLQNEQEWIPRTRENMKSRVMVQTKRK